MEISSYIQPLNFKSICRTCSKTSDDLHSIFKNTDQFPSKTLADILLDVAKIDAKTHSNEDRMPKYLCTTCMQMLQNAYSFVLMAQDTDKKLLQCCKSSVIELEHNMPSYKYMDCLLESPIDIPPNAAEYLHIKLEPNTEENMFDSFPLSDAGNDNFEEDVTETGSLKMKYNDIDSQETTLSNSLKVESNIHFFSGTENEEKDVDPITVSSSENKLLNTMQSDSSDSEWRDKLRRRGRPRLANNKHNCKGRFSCEECNKTFAWKKDLYRHLLCHSSAPGHCCDTCGKQFLRKDKLKDHLKVHQRHLSENIQRGGFEKRKTHSEWNFAKRLYCYKSFKEIKCKLCNTLFETIKKLKSHLVTHVDNSTFHLKENSQIIKELYPQTGEKLDDIKSQICKDIEQCQFSKFYAIINESGYEMCLSDSDTDEDMTLSKYKCEVCSATFARKFQSFEHIKEEHILEKVPYKCVVCKVEFICKEMFEIHSRTQCRNKEKKYQCLKCPGKFMWLENLDEHNCSNRFNSSDYKSQLSKKIKLLKCHLCEKTFPSRKDLKSHKLVHSSETSYKCSFCLQSFSKVDNLRLHLKQVHKYLYRCIKCALCGETFDKLGHLRVHLPIHSDGFTGIDVEKGIYFKTREHDISGTGSESKIVQSIANDFLLQNTSLFYLAVDESGNEIDLNDSETETELSSERIKNESPPNRVYKCEVCMKEYFRRKHMLLHQFAEHKLLKELPHPCEHCNKQFVCLELLQRHLSSECMNKYKKWKCNECSSCFLWEDNLRKHQNIKHVVKEQLKSPKLANKLQCDECDKTFIWPKDLNRHKRCHLPDDEKFECPFCTRRFNRKDNMQAHMKVHGTVASKKNVIKIGKYTKVKALDENYCKPNGCKLIQCMICSSKHTKIADLRTHLRTHKYVVSLNQHKHKDINEISIQLYPGEPLMTEKKLVDRIILDITEERLDRFYSITNEVGNELNISDSETDSDSEGEETVVKMYSCDLCDNTFQRKYKLFEHQRFSHDWLESPHACEVCDARFLSKQFLQKHYTNQCKNTRKRFICKKCPLRFMWKDNLKIHERILHPELGNSSKKLNPPKYQCQVCQRVFSWQKDLTKHMIVHQPETNIFKCLWCPRKFYRKDCLYVHIKRHGVAPQCLAAAESHISSSSGPNGEKHIVCKVCNLQFTSIFALRSHLMESDLDADVSNNIPFKSRHHGYSSLLNYSITNKLGFELHVDDSESDDNDTSIPKPEGATLKYLCEICNLETLRRYEMSIHQRTAHPYEQLPRKCDKCSFKTVSKDILAHHMRTQCYNMEKKFKCNSCSFLFMWEENLRKHIQCIHPIENLSMSTPTSTFGESESNKLFKCEKCKCQYNRKDRLTAHMKKLHPEDNCVQQNTSQTVDVSEKTSKKPQTHRKFLCAFCGHAVTSSSNLIIHMRRHTGEKPFKCDFCEMAFPRSSDLQCHRRTHTGEKPHKCTVCDKAFSRSYKLQTHMRIHSGERPYKCTYCEKSFTQSNDLTLHIRRHTGERPYVCGICGERFIQGTALKNHRTMRGHYEDIEPRKLNLLEQF